MKWEIKRSFDDHDDYVSQKFRVGNSPYHHDATAVDKNEASG